MKKDEIVEEVRQIRNALAKEYNYDVRAMVEAIRNRHRKSRRKVVSLMTKKKTA